MASISKRNDQEDYLKLGQEADDEYLRSCLHSNSLPIDTFVNEAALRNLKNCKHGITLTRHQVYILAYHLCDLAHYLSEDKNKSKRDQNVIMQVGNLTDRLICALKTDEASNLVRSRWEEPFPIFQLNSGHSLDFGDLLRVLDLLKVSTCEEFGPQLPRPAPEGNRTKLVRYYYWLNLMAFWRFVLKRPVRRSSPLIEFISEMSSGSYPFGEKNEYPTLDAISAFIKAQADKVYELADEYDPDWRYDELSIEEFGPAVDRFEK